MRQTRRRRLDGSYRRFGPPNRALDRKKHLWCDADLAAVIANQSRHMLHNDELAVELHVVADQF